MRLKQDMVSMSYTTQVPGGHTDNLFESKAELHKRRAKGKDPER